MAAPSHPPAEHAARLSDLHLLPRRVYRFRVLGMGLAAFPVALVLRELDAPLASWAWLLASCFAWPHLAHWLARRSTDPFQAELRNLMADSMIAGLWAPLLHFNALPSVLLMSVATADKINTGIRGLWLRSLPGMGLAVLAGGLLTGLAFAPATSMPVLLACLPIMVVHTLAVSLNSFMLVRRVQLQNRQLDELSRVDVLTGLDSRRHWQDQAERLLQRRHAGGPPATLALVDLDWFKDINDRHGHAVGDDVLRGIAALVRRAAGPEAHAGRLGGDEFAIALPATQAEAEAMAERLRASVEAFSLPQAPGLRCSVSIGLAQAHDDDLGLREWIESADKALYRAKHGGRNRTASQPAGPSAQPA